MPTPPALPFEIFEHIISLTVAQLSAHALCQPIHTRRVEVQRFLSSSALVCRTFRDIAQPLLFSHAFVHQGSVRGYVTALGRRARDAPPVRTICVGPEEQERAEWDETAAVEVGLVLAVLLPHIPDLWELECATCIPSWEGGWLDAPNKIKHLAFIYQTVRNTPPPPPPTLAPHRLSFIESPSRRENFQTTAHLKVLHALFPSVTHLHFTTRDFFILACALERLRFAAQPHLRELHLEAHETSNRGGFITANAHSHDWRNLPALERLATHALFLPPSDCDVVLPPTLRSLEVLRDSGKAEWKLDLEKIVGKAVRDVPEMEVVEVPWRGDESAMDELREVCDRACVRLLTTS